MRAIYHLERRGFKFDKDSAVVKTASLRLSTSRASSAASEYILYRSNCYIEKITIFLLGAAYAAPFFLIFIWTI